MLPCHLRLETHSPKSLYEVYDPISPSINGCIPLDTLRYHLRPSPYTENGDITALPHTLANSINHTLPFHPQSLP